MSNPNTNSLALAARNNHAPHMRVIHIGKDSQPVTLPKMVSVNSHSWKKSASFGTLHNSGYSLVVSHTVADMVALVSNELPLDTGPEFQEAQSAAQLIADGALQIDNLEPLTFLNSTGKSVQIDDVDDLDSRPSDITFIKCRCVVDRSITDNRITSATAISFQLCLRLLKYIYDINAKTTTNPNANVKLESTQSSGMLLAQSF